MSNTNLDTTQLRTQLVGALYRDQYFHPYFIGNQRETESLKKLWERDPFYTFPYPLPDGSNSDTLKFGSTYGSTSIVHQPFNSDTFRDGLEFKYKRYLDPALAHEESNYQHSGLLRVLRRKEHQEQLKKIRERNQLNVSRSVANYNDWLGVLLQRTQQPFMIRQFNTDQSIDGRYGDTFLCLFGDAEVTNQLMGYALVHPKETPLVLWELFKPGENDSTAHMFTQSIPRWLSEESEDQKVVALDKYLRSFPFGNVRRDVETDVVVIDWRNPQITSTAGTFKSVAELRDYLKRKEHELIRKRTMQ